jgi:stage II sporulation protein D
MAGIEVDFAGGETEMLTLGVAAEIFGLINYEGEGLLVTGETEGLAVSYALWVDLVVRVFDGGVEMNIVPFGQVGSVVTGSAGSFEAVGVDFAEFFDTEIRVLVHGGGIVAVLGLVSDTPLLRNVFVVNSDSAGVTVYVGGVFRNYAFGEGVASFDSRVVNLRISGRRVIGVEMPEAVIGGVIERVGSVIELREWGELPLCHSFTVYGIGEDSGVGRRGIGELLVGADMADFYVIGGRVAAAVITRVVEPTFIRVVIGNSTFDDLVHESVEITGTGAFTVRGGERVARFEAGEIFRVARGENVDFWGGLRFYIAPDSLEERLEIIGLRRNWAGGAYPRYRGVFEISPSLNDGFVIVNELPMEQYLYAVVPSEMPSYHGVEAAKVQAITARTFAYHQFYANRFREFGAHVDDSVISQVYNNIPENEISREAVRATRGLVLMYDGEIILANYFSTSGGTTANFGEVWAVGTQFPSDTPPFLRAASQVKGFEFGDLRREDVASAFFRNTEIEGIDAQFPWFRWQVHMTVEELSERINLHHQVGTLRYMEVTKRGQGGNIMEMIFHGDYHHARVQTEFAVRTALNPRDIPVVRHDGSSSGVLSLMPSAFFTFDLHFDDGVLQAATFFGGGNGHGVGMSQNGVRALLDMGFSYREVLKHYYRGVEITTR